MLTEPWLQPISNGTDDGWGDLFGSQGLQALYDQGAFPEFEGRFLEWRVLEFQGLLADGECMVRCWISPN